MLVTHIERLPGSGYSIGRLFESIRSALPSDCKVSIVQCPTPGQSRFWLPIGIWRAFRGRAQINHLVGDVHYAVLGLFTTQTVLTIHDLNRLNAMTGFRKAVYRWLYFTVPLRCSRVVTAISDHVRDQLIESFPSVSRKIQVIPDCLPAGFRPRPGRFDAKHVRILQVGTKPNKNLERLIEAVAGQGWSLCIVGALTHDQLALLRRCRVSYDNFVDLSDGALTAVYASCDLVVFASLEEGFGLPVLEANAVGRPVITSDLSPMKEVAGDAAQLVNPYDIDSIREGIRRVVEDDSCRETLISAGFRNVSRFSVEAIANQYAALYRQMARFQ